MESVSLPPWLWSSGLVYRERPRPRPRPHLTIYTYQHDDPHILQIGAWPARAASPRPAGGALWQYPLDREPWHLAAPPPDRARLYPDRINVEWVSGTAAPGRGSAGTGLGVGTGAGAGWAPALRGWLTGTALLALLVLLARAAEKCIEKKLFKRRRRSQEWSTPHVRATSQSESEAVPGAQADPPPPYSSCAGPPPAPAAPALAQHKAPPEEPPPPYSECFVQLSDKHPPSTSTATLIPHQLYPLPHTLEQTSDNHSHHTLDQTQDTFRQTNDNHTNHTLGETSDNRPHHNPQQTSDVHISCGPTTHHTHSDAVAGPSRQANNTDRNRPEDSDRSATDGDRDDTLKRVIIV